jgi:hypothetical protein
MSRFKHQMYKYNMSTPNLITKYTTLPTELVLYILQFDNRFILRNGKLMSRISHDTNRSRLLTGFCMNRVYEEPQWWFEPCIIDLQITDNKSYTFEILCIHNVYDNEETENPEIRRMLYLHESLSNIKLLCEY